jgi:beta-lactamase superfamily II metal-dependent hydrolase
MPATDVDKKLVESSGDFVAACRPTDLVYFTLNVGDGDTQLLLLPEHDAGRRYCIVVDCIRANKLFALIDELAAAQLLKDVQPLITLVVATHPHDDHISGMAALLRRFGNGHIGEFWEPGYYHTSAAYIEMMRELEDHDVSHLQPAGGTTRYVETVKVTVLGPGIGLRNRFDSYGVNINNASIVLKIEFPAARILKRKEDRTLVQLDKTQTLILGADAQTFSWGQVLVDFPQLGPIRTAVTDALRRSGGTTPLDAQIFKVPHHGSKHGLNLELVEAIHPEVSIVSSVHEGGRYHFPHDVTQAALREAIDPISSKPQGKHKPDPELRILYTSSRKVDGDAGDSDLGPLGTVCVLLGPGGRREIWRFGDEPTEEVQLGDGRPMKPAA